MLLFFVRFSHFFPFRFLCVHFISLTLLYISTVRIVFTFSFVLRTQHIGILWHCLLLFNMLYIYHIVCALCSPTLLSCCCWLLLFRLSICIVLCICIEFIQKTNVSCAIATFNDWLANTDSNRLRLADWMNDTMCAFECMWISYCISTFHFCIFLFTVRCSLTSQQPLHSTIYIYSYSYCIVCLLYIYNFERLSAYLAISFTFSISILYLILLGICMFLNLFSLNVNLRLCACVCVLCIFGLYFGSVCISYVDVGFSVFLRVLCFLCDSYTYILPFAGSEFVFSFSVYFFLILLCKAAPA